MTLIRSAPPLQSVPSSDPDRVHWRRWRHPGARARTGRQRPELPSPLLVVLSKVQTQSSLRRHYNLCCHQTIIESVGDGGVILALELGLDGGDLEDLCVVVQRGLEAAMEILNID
jgi:hypothetical protein